MYEQPGTGSNKLGIILIAVLGIGVLGFAIFALVEYQTATKATTTLTTQKQAAASAARADQKSVDAANTEIASESPFRSYIAPVAFGSFEIKFPKNWSSWVDEEQSSNTQVTLLVQPDFVRETNSVAQLAAAKVVLIQRTLNDYMQQFQNTQGLKQTDVTVSGIQSIQVTGPFTDRRTVRMVAVPVRDKTLVFTNEDAKYDDQFSQILAQSKINP